MVAHYLRFLKHRNTVRIALMSGIVLIVATIAFAQYNKAHSNKCAPLSRWSALDCYQKNIKDAFDSGGYEGAMRYIQDLDVWKHPKSTECHWIMHALGNVVYESTQDPIEALRIFNPSCSGGYMHGILETYMNEKGEEFILKPDMIMDACEVNKDKLFQWECYHGLGHALARVLENDSLAALAMCDSASGSMQRERCYYGVFMENAYSYDNGYDGPPKKYLYPNGNLPLCELVEESQKRACYRFSGHAYLGATINARPAEINTLSIDDVRNAYNNACATIESAEYREQCASGIPIFMYTAWEGDGGRMKEGCAQFTRQNDRNKCYGLSAGIFARYDIHNEGLAEKFCASLLEEEKSACILIADETIRFFGPIIYSY